MTDTRDDAQKLLDSRRAVYGDRVSNMERTAALWSALLNVKIEDWQVPLMMSAYKMLRTFEKPDYSDNSDDIDGWKKMFVEVMDANHGGIIKARTVEEYQAELSRRESDFFAEELSKVPRVDTLPEGFIPARFERVDPTHIPLQAQAEGEAIDAFQHRQTEEVAAKIDHQNPYRNVPQGVPDFGFHLEHRDEGPGPLGWVHVDDTGRNAERTATPAEVNLWLALLEVQGERA